MRKQIADNLEIEDNFWKVFNSRSYKENMIIYTLTLPTLGGLDTKRAWETCPVSFMIICCSSFSNLMIKSVYEQKIHITSAFSIRIQSSTIQRKKGAHKPDYYHVLSVEILLTNFASFVSFSYVNCSVPRS